MQTKKKLIGRLAIAAGIVLAVALAVVAISTVKLEEGREGREAAARREREAVVERSRKYLAELAPRLRQLPADPAVLGEIESRYFEEQASGAMHVWAMDTEGRFLFGVPREVFEKLNAVYDHDVVPNLKEGVFLDRQTFLRRLADSSDEIGPGSFTAEPSEDDQTAWERLRRYAYDSDSAFVVSTPLRSADGRALGSLYLKRVLPERRERWREDRPADHLRDVAGTFAGFSAAFLWLLLPTWVYVDARGRAVRRAWLFAFLTAISALIGLVVYLIARPETPGALTCPGCSREIDGGSYCPHCGHDLSAAICSTCRYPLKADWAFCPACRTEIRPAAATTAPPPASEPATQG